MLKITMWVLKENIGTIMFVLLVTLVMFAYILTKIATDPESFKHPWDKKGMMWLGIALIIAGIHISGLDLLLVSLITGTVSFDKLIIFPINYISEYNIDMCNRVEKGFLATSVGIFVIYMYVFIYVFHTPFTDYFEIQKILEDDSDFKPKLSKEERKKLAKTYPRGLCYPYTAKRIIHLINQKIREEHIPYHNPDVGDCSKEFTQTNLAHWTNWFHNCSSQGAAIYYMLIEFDYMKRDSVSFNLSPFFSLPSPDSANGRPPVPLFFYNDAALQYILQQIRTDPEHIMEKINQEIAKLPFSGTYTDCSDKLSSVQKNFLYDMHMTCGGLIYPYSIYKIVKVINRWIRLYHIPFVNPSLPDDPKLANTFTTRHLKLFHTCVDIQSYLKPLQDPYLIYYLEPEIRFKGNENFIKGVPFYTETALRYIVKQIKKNPKMFIRFRLRPYTFYLYKQFARKRELQKQKDRY